MSAQQPRADEVDFGEPPAPTRWQRAADVINLPLPEAIVEGLAWAGCLTVLVGESAASKTFVLLDLAASVSADLPWHRRGVRHGSVVYLSFEGHLGLRLRALREVAGHYLEHVYVVRAGDPLSPSLDRDRNEIPSRGELDAIRDLDQIAAALAADARPPVVLVVVDTIRASLAGSEDSSEAVAAYLRATRRIMAHAPGAGCLLAHHAGWQDGENRKKRERGSSAFRGNADGTLYLDASAYDRETRTARLTLTSVKVRDGEQLPPLHLIRKQVELPGLADRWGNPVTSCLIYPDPRTREDREAESARAAEAVDREQDRALLRVIRDHPEATSQRLLRALVRTKSEVFNAALDGLILAGLVTPPPKQRTPYALTPAGLAALEAE